MTTRHFTVHGIVRCEETGEPVPGLRVRAYDKDVLRDDHLGDARTDEAGRFSIQFTTPAFQDFTEERPDVYLRIFDPSGATEIQSTRKQTRRDSRSIEHYELRVPPQRVP